MVIPQSTPPDERGRRRVVLISALVLGVAVLLAVLILDRHGTQGRQSRGTATPGATSTSSLPATSFGRTATTTTTLVDQTGEPYHLPSAMDGLPWATKVLDDDRRIGYTKNSVSGYGIDDISGETTNVRGGVRTTLPPADCAGCARRTIWFVGGGAAFGLGQRDSGTIASGIVRFGSSAGLALDVRNIAVPGWTLWQEYQAVLGRLRTGSEHPDLVVFYDGFNDIDKTVAQTVAYGPPNWDAPVVFDQALFEAAKERRYTPEEVQQAMQKVGGVEELGRHAGRRFETLRSTAAATLAAMGVRTEFFFQADAIAAPSQFKAATEEYTVLPPELIEPAGRAVAAATGELSSAEHNLRALFADRSDPVFVDLLNLNEAGAQRVALAVYAQLSNDAPDLFVSTRR